MRDLYLKAFEIAVKGAKMTVKYTFDDTGATATKVMRACTGIMPAQNCAPGTTYKTALSPWKIPFTALAVLFYALFALYIWRVVLRIRDQKQHREHFKPSRKERKKTAQ